MPPVKQEMRRRLSCGQLLRWRSGTQESRPILRVAHHTDRPTRRASCVCGVEYWVPHDAGTDAAPGRVLPTLENYTVSVA